MTDDAWWHLGLGRAYAAAGPWLPNDPLLFLAPGPAPPAAWLGDLGLHGVQRGAGFAGLRALHVGLVAAILGLAWSLLRRASGSAAVASLGTIVFIALGSYRFFQLRPHLATILLTLALYKLLLEDDRPASWKRVVVAVGLFALWANVHASFLLGLALIGAATASLLVASPLRTPEQRRADRAQALPLAATLGLGLLASLVNPNGAKQHLAYFAAGATTPELGGIADEWARIDLFALPPANLPPSELSWGLIWVLLVIAPVAAGAAVWSWRCVNPKAAPGAGPVLIALAATGLAGTLVAVRFLWLGIFPLLLLAATARTTRPARQRATARTGSAVAVALVPAFLWLGPWPMISASMPRSWPAYSAPYLADRYNGHAVWALQDMGLEGNLYNEYHQGGFLGFWLAPSIRTFINGSLNVPPEALAAHSAIRQYRGVGPDEGLDAVLDRYGVDLFLGTRLPQVPKPNRPNASTTAHLERAPGWLPIFRNLKSALYLRRTPQNQANLERVAAYYAREGVPFEPETGFEPARVIREAPDWAFRHGMVPADLRALEQARRHLDPAMRRNAANRLASIFAALGLYERALVVDEELLRTQPQAWEARRRQVWALLRLGRTEAAVEAAAALDGAPKADRLGHAIARSARRAASFDTPEERRRLAARLPVFTRPEAQALLSGLIPPRQRTPGP